MDKLKKKCFQILLEIDRVCKCANLQYYIYAGTLLGAIRHGGFIPWDDDIDIVMMRKDYDEFVNACEKYLNHEKFELQTIYSDPYASNPWMKLHDKNTAFIDGGRREGAMEGINIDIFPVDNVPDSEKKMKRRAKYFDIMNFVYQYRFFNHSKTSSWKMRLYQRAILFIPPWNEMKFKEKYNRKMQEYNNRDTENVVYFSNRKYLKKVVPRSCFETKVMLKFEDGMFPAPGGWEEILVGLYGENYMQLPSEEQRVTNHGTTIIDLEHSWKEYKRGFNGYEKI